jgi:hypothetical protein
LYPPCSPEKGRDRRARELPDLILKIMWKLESFQNLFHGGYREWFDEQYISKSLALNFKGVVNFCSNIDADCMYCVIKDILGNKPLSNIWKFANMILPFARHRIQCLLNFASFNPCNQHTLSLWVHVIPLKNTEY